MRATIKIISPPVVICVLVGILAIASACSSASAEALSIKSVKIDADSSDDAGLAGHSLQVTLENPACPDDYLVLLHSVRAAVKVDSPDTPNVWSVSVPPNTPPGTYPLQIDDHQHNLIAKRNVTIYRLALPKVTDISPPIVEADGNRLITVHGENLFAPKQAIRLVLGGYKTDTVEVDPAGTWFIAKLTDDPDPETFKAIKPTQLSVWNLPAEIPVKYAQLLHHRVDRWDMTAWSLGFLLIPLLAVWLLSRGGGRFRYRVLGQKRRPFWQLLLIDEVTKTYSLSRFQFIWWLLISSVSYVFVMWTHGKLTDQWSFLTSTDDSFSSGLKSLAGSTGALAISSLTLIGAQAATRWNGNKGGGDIDPRLSDLVMQGGVFALDRLQQLLWTFIAGIGFLVIVWNSFPNATSLPPIPGELLGLMGLSSAVYLGGKLTRSPGPNITQVTGEAGSAKLTITGTRLSRGAGGTAPKSGSPSNTFVQTPGTVKGGFCRIMIDQVEVSQHLCTTLAPDPDAPDEFAASLLVYLADKDADWLGQDHSVTVQNADAQFATWSGTPGNRVVPPNLQDSPPIPDEGPQPSFAASRPSPPPDSAPENQIRLRIADDAIAGNFARTQIFKSLDRQKENIVVSWSRETTHIGMRASMLLRDSDKQQLINWLIQLFPAATFSVELDVASTGGTNISITAKEISLPGVSGTQKPKATTEKHGNPEPPSTDT